MKYHQRNKLKLDDFEEDGNEVTWVDMQAKLQAIKIERAPVCKKPGSSWQSFRTTLIETWCSIDMKNLISGIK